MKCLADQYLTYTQNQIKKYFKLVYGTKFNKEIIDEYMKTYMNARYYNIVNTNKPARAFYLRILDEIEYKRDILLAKNEKDTQDIIEKENNSIMIENINEAFQYILFFDDVRDIKNFKTIKNIKEIAVKFVECIRKDYDVKESVIDELTDMLEKAKDKKTLYLENLQSDEFVLELEECSEIENTYFVELKHQIKMPSQYSESAIKKVFTEGLIAEDKLAVEYILLTMVSLRDIIEGNFEDKYIAEFEPSIFKKQAKFASTIDWLDNPAIQEKISVNIYYEDYIKNQKLILDYIKKGFSFVITLDGKAKTVEDVEKLKMFKIVVATENLALYKELKQNKNLFKNVIFR